MALASSAVAQLRSLVFELRPAELEADGLVPTLQSHLDVLRRVYGVRISVSADVGQRLPPGLESAMFRVAQEAVHNALRHGRPSHVEVRLAREDETAILEVTDDGAGFDVNDRAARSRHLGLTTMRERAEEAGGSLTIRSRPGEGTTVSVEVPVGR